MPDLLPPSATDVERALAELFKRLNELPVPIRDMWNADTIPVALLPWLAWAFSVDEWAGHWSEQQRRDTIKNALAVQRMKGTINSVRQGLAALGIDARVQEWMNQIPAGDPYTFKLHLQADQTPVDLDGIKAALAVLERNKNLRSHLDGIYVSARSVARLHAGVVTGIGHEITLTEYRAAMLVINELAIVLE